MKFNFKLFQKSIENYKQTGEEYTISSRRNLYSDSRKSNTPQSIFTSQVYVYVEAIVAQMKYT